MSPSEQDAAMTHQPGPYGQIPQPVMPDYAGPPPVAPKGRGRVAAIAAAIVVLALLAGGILYAAGTFSGGGLSKAAAERACRTAFGSEWQKRTNTAVGGTETTIIPTVKSIDLMETWESDGGWSVNGTVHYTLTTALIAPVDGSIDLTCTATGSDDAPETAVANRN